LLGYVLEITTPICDIDAIILVSAVFHDAIFTARTPRGSLHLNQIVTSLTLRMA